MLSRRERIEASVGRFLLGLPAPLQRALAGGRATRIDGQTLEADVQLALALLAKRPDPPLESLSPGDARRQIAHTARTFAGTPLPMARVETVSIPGLDGPIPARFYRPALAAGAQPLLVYLHGGGWVVGDLDVYDPVCRFLAREAGVCVLSVDYRLAPEHRFPAAVDDAFSAFRFAAENASALGVDPRRIAVGGDSAGGNLSAVVSQLAAQDGGARPAFQLLFYPVTDLSEKHASYRLFADGFFLTEAQMDWYRGHYLPDDVSARDPRASPLLAKDLGGLPPALVVTAGFDVLRDEGEAYAERLRSAGVPVVQRRHPGTIHGFCNTTSISRSGRAYMQQAARNLREALAG